MFHITFDCRNCVQSSIKKSHYLIYIKVLAGSSRETEAGRVHKSTERLPFTNRTKQDKQTQKNIGKTELFTRKKYKCSKSLSIILSTNV